MTEGYGSGHFVDLTTGEVTYIQSDYMLEDVTSEGIIEMHPISKKYWICQPKVITSHLCCNLHHRTSDGNLYLFYLVEDKHTQLLVKTMKRLGED